VRAQDVPPPAVWVAQVARPVLSIFVLALAFTAAFFHRHAHENFIAIVFAAFYETFEGTWNLILAEGSKRSAVADRWKDGREADLKKLIEQAKVAATNLQDNLQARAKSAGVPVEEYRKQAGVIVDDLMKKVNEATTYAEGQAKNAGVPVDDYKKQAGVVIEDLRKKINEATGYFETQVKETKDKAKKESVSAKKQGAALRKQLNGAVSEQGNGNAGGNLGNLGNLGGNLDGNLDGNLGGNVNTESADRVFTPLGGHDPLALNAPTYAQMTTE